jgi:hypothetical protein
VTRPSPRSCCTRVPSVRGWGATGPPPTVHHMAPGHRSHTDVRRTAALSWAVLVAAVLQVVAPLVTISGPGSSPGGGSGPDLLITPVGWAFSIWGVIYLLAIAQAVCALLPASGRVPTRLMLDQVVLYLAAVVWIVVAALDTSTGTFLALAVMFAAAVDGVLTLRRAELSPSWFRTLTRVAFGLFAGWVSAAFFLNLSTAVVSWGWFDADDVAWQLVVVAVATLVLAALVLTGRLAAYAAAGVWALVGIAVTGADDGTTEVLVAAVVGGVVVAGAAFFALARRGGHHHGTPAPSH